MTVMTRSRVFEAVYRQAEDVTKVSGSSLGSAEIYMGSHGCMVYMCVWGRQVGRSASSFLFCFLFLHGLYIHIFLGSCACLFQCWACDQFTVQGFFLASLNLLGWQFKRIRHMLEISRNVLFFCQIKTYKYKFEGKLVQQQCHKEWKIHCSVWNPSKTQEGGFHGQSRQFLATQPHTPTSLPHALFLLRSYVLEPGPQGNPAFP